MKIFSTLFVVAALFASPLVHAQTPPAPAPLPAQVKTELEAALKAVDPTNSEAVSKVVMDAIAKNPSLAPSIVGLAVQVIGQALVNNPAVARTVIPDFVLAAAKSQPGLVSQIIGSAITALPATLKVPVIPRLVEVVVAQTEDRRVQADILNAAYLATGDIPEVVTLLDRIASENRIEIVEGGPANTDEEGEESIRYVVEDQLAEEAFSGDQGAINQGGTVGGFGGSGGGSGSGSGGTSGSGGGSSPTPTPTPTPAPTPVS